MQPQELEIQIKKFKSRRLKTRLANYGTLVSIFLTLSIFADGFTPASLISFLLLLPLPLYFVLQSLKLGRKSRDLKTRMESLCDLISGLTPPKFSMRKFITQPSFAFRLSLILFFLVFFTTFSRLRTPDPTLSYQPYAVSRTP